MSQKQKNETASADKWRDLAGQDEDEHLLEGKEAASVDESSDKKLTDHVNQLEKQIDFYKDQVARAHAEAENTRRRMEQEVSKARKFGVERLVSDLIPVVDSLVRGMEGSPSSDPQVQLMRKGMELTLEILDKILEKNGITQIAPLVGEAFDPAQHEAMSMRPDPDVKSNTILQVLQKGYALNGRVIRAAMVIVSA